MRGMWGAAAVAAAVTVVLGAGPGVAGAAAQAAAVQWAQVSAGYHDTCAVQTGHTLGCRGAGKQGQLGDGSTTSQDSPVRVGARAGWTQAAVGLGHACAVRKDGTAWCWGLANSGDLGNGTTTGQYDRPVQVGGVAITRDLGRGLRCLRDPYRRHALVLGRRRVRRAGERHRDLQRVHTGPGRHRRRLDQRVGVRPQFLRLRCAG